MLFTLCWLMIVGGCQERKPQITSMEIEDLLSSSDKYSTRNVRVAGCLERDSLSRGDGKVGFVLAACNLDLTPDSRSSVALFFAANEDLEKFESLLGERVSFEGVYLESDLVTEQGSYTYGQLMEAQLASGLSP